MTDHEFTDRYAADLWIRPDIAKKGVAFLRTTGLGVYLPADKVEEVCAALREAAGLPPVWTVEKREDDGLVAPNGYVRWLPSGPAGDDPNSARGLAARLLAAADEAEARANRPKLPTAENSVIKLGDNVWVRHGGSWYCPGSLGGADDEYMAPLNFTILHDPEKAS